MPPINKRFIPWTIITIGFTSITAQVLLMRELVVIFYGNELSLGVMLGVWLFWTALGSSLLPGILRKTHNTHFQIGLIQLSLSLLLPFVLILVRSSRQILGITLGEMIGFTHMLFITLFTLAPICLLSGLLYTLSCQLVYNYEYSSSKSISKVYLLESLGSGLAGLITSFFFVRFINPTHIFLILSIINLTSAVLVGNINPLHSRPYRTAWYLIVFSLAGGSGFYFAPKFQNFCDKILWKGYNLVSIRNTMYGNIAITRIGDQITFFQNGLMVFTAPDRQTAEESVHFSLLEHPSPKKVLMIGGGLGGGIQEALGHPSIERIDYVELDPTIVQLAQQYLPKEQTRSFQDPRVKLYHVDGRRYIKRTPEKFDMIILNLPNPYTAQLNRFYTLEFFREVERALLPSGIFSLQVSSSENAIGPELSDFLSTLSATLKLVFTEMVIIPGEINRFLVSNQPGQLTSDPQILIQRLKSRQIETLYVREYYIPYQMSEERQTYLQSHIHPVSSDRLNLDFKPVGYFYDTILWATYFSSVFKKLFLAFAGLKSYTIAGFFALTALFLILIKWRPKSRTRLFSSAVLYSIIGVGFTEISLEVILILGFQVLYGYVYQQLAFIVAGYMVGLALGSWLTISKNIPDQKTFPLFRSLQFCMIVYPLFIAGFFWLSHHPSSISLPVWTSWFYPCLTGGAGFIGGFQFPMANRLYLHSKKSIKRVAGFLYASDLLGSSAGALLTSAFLIPILGIPPTLMILAFYNFCSLIVLMMSKDPHQSLQP